jgi:nucleoside recognition membrane protein YjiH
MSSSTKAKCTTLSLVRLIVVILFFIVCFCIPFYKDGKAESFLEFIMEFPLGFALICIEEALHNLKI